MLIFAKSEPGRRAHAQQPCCAPAKETLIPAALQRQSLPRWPEVSELQVVRHFTQLSQRNFALDTHFYPLGSCTMKYNPRGVHHAASLREFTQQHPLSHPDSLQGTLTALHALQQYLADITGMAAVSLTPMAGSQGELAGVAMIKAYHLAHGETERCEILIPDAAHGTNPASAAMCGFRVIEIPTDRDGELDMARLKQQLGPKTAGIMLTNPSTLGLFMRQISKVAAAVHAVGGLLYYDGANLNAIVGQVKPGDMGFDVMHLNLHKTFATPHGAGGPGAGPVAVSAKLAPFLPGPLVTKTPQGYRWSTPDETPHSIGRLSCFMGNVGILLRAYFYLRLLGQRGLLRVSEYATLNANYLLKQLTRIGYHPAYPDRLASHELILTLAKEKTQYGIQAMDVAKRLLDYHCHAPTIYFPLMVPECLLIEPTETECKAELDHFIAAMERIRQEARTHPEQLKQAPHHLTIKRLDEVKAARELQLNYFHQNVD